ncbi:hypothetical protein MKEN_01370700 [Mycena kentingensis (nom. inval.)]|nr:hypothetical protein MKEN_01370700 [Mycena kentingensis (nom. inval.)]
MLPVYDYLLPPNLIPAEFPPYKSPLSVTDNLKLLGDFFLRTGADVRLPVPFSDGPVTNGQTPLLDHAFNPPFPARTVVTGQCLAFGIMNGKTWLSLSAWQTGPGWASSAFEHIASSLDRIAKTNERPVSKVPIDALKFPRRGATPALIHVHYDPTTPILGRDRRRPLADKQ